MNYVNSYLLRLLDPAVDLDLYSLAYAWRSSPKRHTQPDRMSFEDFTDPNALAIGLFNGELQAVYFLHETEPGDFQFHLTSRRGFSRSVLLEAGCLILTQILENGATKIHAWIIPRNRPLRLLALESGFQKVESREFDVRGRRTVFDLYVLKGAPIASESQSQRHAEG